MASQLQRRHPWGDRVVAGELCRRHANAGKARLVLGDIGRDLVGRQRMGIDLSLAGEDDDVAAQPIAIQFQRNLRPLGDVPQLGCARPAVDRV